MANFILANHLIDYPCELLPIYDQEADKLIEVLFNSTLRRLDSQTIARLSLFHYSEKSFQILLINGINPLVDKDSSFEQLAICSNIIDMLLFKNSIENCSKVSCWVVKDGLLYKVKNPKDSSQRLRNGIRLPIP